MPVRDGPDTVGARGWRHAARTFTHLAAWGALLATAGASLAELHWTFELVTHFKAQQAGGTLVLAVLAAGLRLRAVTAVCGLVFLVNAAYLVPWLVPQPKSAVATTESLRILSANVSFRNRDVDGLRQLVTATRPDVIGLVEVSLEWAEMLSVLHPDYPYRIVRPHEGAFGLALLSRVPIVEALGSPYHSGGMNAAILAELAFGEHSVDIALVHLMAPTSPSASALRNVQLAELSGLIRGDGDHRQVLIGDLNITPWSPYYRFVEADAGLINAARGNGYLGSWPTSPFFLRIPIDHCLLSPELEADSIRLGPDIGSDHLPLIIDISGWTSPDPG